MNVLEAIEFAVMNFGKEINCICLSKVLNQN